MKKIILLAFLPLLFFSCKEDIHTTIPNSPVHLALDLRFEDSKLNAKLSHAAFSEKRKASDKLGYGGILVINGYGVNPVTLFAYDLACPIEVVRSVRVVPNDEGNCSCPKCGSVFDIANGNGVPISGPAAESGYFLRSYLVAPTGDNTYVVTNSYY